MDFAFSEEQEQLRREARAFLEANPDAPLLELRELGWLGVSVVEDRGGGGLSFVDEAILFEEAGRGASTQALFLTTSWSSSPPCWRSTSSLLARARPARPHLDTVDQVLREDMTAVPAGLLA